MGLDGRAGGRENDSRQRTHFEAYFFNAALAEIFKPNEKE
jgi:hypothetical protein